MPGTAYDTVQRKGLSLHRPTPEYAKEAETAIGAARAQQQRGRMH
ncbi:hypothetical protein [Pantoea sp. 18069]|nr:hypothetical protein [Pantoea sp. 18069]